MFLKPPQNPHSVTSYCREQSREKMVQIDRHAAIKCDLITAHAIMSLLHGDPVISCIKTSIIFYCKTSITHHSGRYFREHMAYIPWCHYSKWLICRVRKLSTWKQRPYIVTNYNVQSILDLQPLLVHANHRQTQLHATKYAPVPIILCQWFNE